MIKAWNEWAEDNVMETSENLVFQCWKISMRKINHLNSMITKKKPK